MRKLGLLLPLLLSTFSALAVVSITANKPAYNFQVLPGSVRTINAYITGGTANTVNWTVSGTTGGATATLSASTGALPEVTVTIGPTAGTCSISGGIGTYSVTSTATVTVQAQSTDDTSKTATFLFNVCANTTNVHLVPQYQQAFKTQPVQLQSGVVGNTNEQVNWAITGQPSGGDGALQSTSGASCTAGTASGTWQQISLPSAMTANSKQISTLFAATDCYLYVSVKSNGTWRAKISDLRSSPTNTANWVEIDSGFPTDPNNGGPSDIFAWQQDSAGNVYGAIGGVAIGGVCSYCIVGKWNGSSWSFSANPPSMTGHISAINFDSAGNEYAFAIGGMLYKSTNGGTSWTTVTSNAYTNAGLTSGSVFFARIINGSIYWGGEGPYMQSNLTMTTNTQVYASSFSGNAFWIETDGSNSSPGTYIDVMGARCDGSGNCEGRSTGGSFSTVTGSGIAAYGSISSDEAMIRGPVSGNIYAALNSSGQTGIVRSTDGGLTWSSFSTGLPSTQNSHVQRMAVSPIDDSRYVSTGASSSPINQLWYYPQSFSGGPPRDNVFTASVTGRYTITATSAADGSKSDTAIVYVSPNSPPSYAATPNETQPTECYPDPAMTGTDYEVGPGKAFTTIRSVPTNTWAAGSIMRIWNTDTTGSSPTTYHEYTEISQAGTKAQPSVVCGVPDSSGNLPVVDGSSAFGPSWASTAASAGYGIISTWVHGAFGYWQSGSVGPSYLTISGLHIKNATPANSYTVPAGGSTANYIIGASCINLRSGSFITLEGNDMDTCTNGFFSAENTNSAWAPVTQFVDVRGNHMHNSGWSTDFTEHQAYFQSFYGVLEGNRIDNYLSTAQGSNFKWRGVEGIFRYNYLGNGPTREFDLVDNQDAGAYVNFEYYLSFAGDTNCNNSLWCQGDTAGANVIAGYQESLEKDFSYGNIIAGNTTSVVTIHYGMDHDNGMADRGGTLYWYNNTHDGAAQVFDTTAGGGSDYNSFYWQNVYAANNIFWNTNSNVQQFSLNTLTTFLGDFHTNLYKSGSISITTPITGGNYNAGTADGWVNTTNAITQAWNLASPMDPHMTGISSANFLLTSTVPYSTSTFIPPSGSAAINAGSALTGPATQLPVRYQYVPSSSSLSARTSPLTIGAVDPAGGPPTLVSIAISGSNSVGIGQNIQLTATGTYSDSSTADLTSSSTWASSAPSFATVNTTGLVRGVAIGSTNITASNSSITSPNFHITVTPAVPTFTPPAGSYSGTQTVTVNCPAGLTCFYTTDGSTPSIAGFQYTTPLTVSSTQTIKVIAVKAGVLARNTGNSSTGWSCRVASGPVTYGSLTCTTGGGIGSLNPSNVVWTFGTPMKETMTTNSATGSTQMLFINGTDLSACPDCTEVVQDKIVQVDKDKTFLENNEMDAPANMNQNWGQWHTASLQCNQQGSTPQWQIDNQQGHWQNLSPPITFGCPISTTQQTEIRYGIHWTNGDMSCTDPITGPGWSNDHYDFLTICVGGTNGTGGSCQDFTLNKVLCGYTESYSPPYKMVLQDQPDGTPGSQNPTTSTRSVWNNNATLAYYGTEVTASATYTIGSISPGNTKIQGAVKFQGQVKVQ